MLGVARGLAQRGLPVDLVLARAAGPFLGLVPDAVRLVDLGSWRTASSLPAMLKYLRRECPGTLVSSHPHANVNALLARKLLAGRLPVIALRSTNFSLRHADASLKERLAMQMEKRLLPSASAIVTVSPAVADDLRRIAPSTASLLRVIHDPVVWPDHADHAAMPVTHSWFNGAGPPVIMAAGSLVKLKGYATLLAAFARLVKLREARLVILGEGPERSHLIQLAERLEIGCLVDFPGFQLNSSAYMAKATLLVLSSTYEALPNTLIEAMACGLPVVSTDCPSGPTEILEGGKWGRLVPVNDAQALADAILETLDKPVAPDLLKARAAAYSAQTSIDRYMELLAQVQAVADPAPPHPSIHLSPSPPPPPPHGLSMEAPAQTHRDGRPRRITA